MDVFFAEILGFKQKTLILFTYAVISLYLSFELVVYLEGTSESTGTTMQARTSYRSSDICWGNRFKQIVFFDKLSMNYVVDLKKFEETIEVSGKYTSFLVN